jgi:hypothetical protein
MKYYQLFRKIDEIRTLVNYNNNEDKFGFYKIVIDRSNGQRFFLWK